MFQLEAFPSVLAYPGFDLAPEFDLDREIRALHAPGIPVLEPMVRFFDLASLVYLLLEHSVAVAYAVAVAGQVQGCQAVQEAGGQPAEAAVAQPRVRFLILDPVIVESQLVQDLADSVHAAEVHEVVAEGPAHQEFGRKVEGLLARRGVEGFPGSHPVIQYVFHRSGGNRVVDIVVGSFGKVLAVTAFQPEPDVFFECMLVQGHVILRR